MEDYYSILDLPVDASTEDVKARYRLLVRIFHPDRYPKSEDKAYAEQRLQKINEAYETIQGKRAHGLALSVDERPPQPIISPRQIDFGQVTHGERARAHVDIDNVGGQAQALNFKTENGVDWITVINGQRLAPDEPLPMRLMLEATTESLVVDEIYESWLDINMNGVAVRVPLRLNVVDQLGPSRSVNWLLTSTLTLIAIILLYLGWNWISGSSVSPTTVALGTTEAEATPMDVASASHIENEQLVDVSMDNSIQTSIPALIRDGTQDGSDRDGAIILAAIEKTPQIAAIAIVTNTQATNTPVPTTALTPPATETTTLEPIATSTVLASATPMSTATATDLPTVTPLPGAIVAEASVAPPVSSSMARETPGVVALLTVPQTFDVNARADTSVDSASLGLLPKGTTYRGIARTLDNAWTQIILSDGRVAWVFTDTMSADIEQIAKLPVSTVLLDVATIAERPDLDVIVSTGDTDDVTALEPEIVSAPLPVKQETFPQRHSVQSGEFLKQIAMLYYGDEALWERIYEANLALIGPDPNQLEAGMELIIPAE